MRDLRLEERVIAGAAFFPPDFSPAYLKAAMVPLFETLEIAAAATFLTVILGLLLALYIGAHLPDASILYALLTSLRALPDLTLAIFCVIILGLGPAAGVVALTSRASQTSSRVTRCVPTQLCRHGD